MVERKERNAEIIAYAKAHPEQTLKAIGTHFGGITGERVRLIIAVHGKGYRRPGRRYRCGVVGCRIAFKAEGHYRGKKAKYCPAHRGKVRAS